MFEKSPETKSLLRHFNRKFGQIISPKALLKTVCCISSKLERPRPSMLDVAPTRHIKTWTTDDVKEVCDSEFYLDIPSDFTMNYLKKYEKRLMKGKCIMPNDFTLTFSTKSERAKYRLTGGLSELLADEKYGYGSQPDAFRLKGKVTLIANMTSESYVWNKNKFLGSTLKERLLVTHHVLTRVEKRAWVKKEESAKKIHYKYLITVDDIALDVKIPQKYNNFIAHLAREFSYLTLNNEISCQDLIKGAIRGHASLNERDTVRLDDFDFLHMIKDYLVDPFNPYEGLIVKYTAQGFSRRDVCKKLGKNLGYLKRVQQVVDRARLRGILDVEPPTPKP